MTDAIKKYGGYLLLIPIGLFLVIFVAPIFLLALLWDKIIGYWLNVRFRLKHKFPKKNILFIYSNSPNWKDYIDDNLLDKLQPSTIFLNWSERSNWNTSQLEVKVFKHWASDREFNPMAIVFEENSKVRTIRFYKAFKNRNHGDEKLLQLKEKELFSYVN
tara:strand:- start:1735 stop:2214 length:480 start_codon:yes stop_codon:yes gene_type:complete